MRLEYEAAMEDRKQRAVRCTEDVVRREEAQKREETLAHAEARWKEERQQLFKDAHQNQLRAIARQSQKLEEKLRKEFSETLVRFHKENKQHLEAVVEQTWREADEVKRKAIAEARREEQELAGKEARNVAERVAREKQQEAELASEEKAHALEEQHRALEKLKAEELREQQSELERQFEMTLKETRIEYEAQLNGLQHQYKEQVATSERLSNELQSMTDSRDEWKQKYENLKLEFSDFIDQFPGFKGDFLLK